MFIAVFFLEIRADSLNAFDADKTKHERRKVKRYNIYWFIKTTFIE